MEATATRAVVRAAYGQQQQQEGAAGGQQQQQQEEEDRGREAERRGSDGPFEASGVYDFEAMLTSDAVREDIERHPSASVLFALPDDVRVTHKKRKNHSALASTIPPEAVSLVKGDDYLRDCVGLFTQDWTVIRRRSHERHTLRRDERVRSRRLLSPEAEANLSLHFFESCDPPPSPAPALAIEEDTAAHKKTKKKGKKTKTRHESPACDANESAPAAENNDSVLAQYSALAAQGNFSKTKVDLFSLYIRTEEYSAFPISTEKTRNYFAREAHIYNGVQLLITPRKLTFALGNFEPFYGVLALYDISKKMKISENFYFDLNDESIMAKLKSSGNWSTRNNETKRALFKVAKPSPDIYLVLRIEKVLQGDPEDSLDLYAKYDSIKEKDKERLETHARECYRRFGEYRQGMGWSVLPLFGSDGQLALAETATFQPIYRYRPEASDSHFYGSWADQSKASASKRLKTIPGSCIVEVTEVSDASKIGGRLTPCLIPLKPAASADNPQSVMEVEELGGIRGNDVATDYVNNLYVYPELVNIAASGRNLAISVQVLNSDRDPEALLPLSCVYTHSGDLGTEGVTLVSYHAKNPSYYDEFKIKLPPYLRPGHHLLFTLFHLPVQIAKNRDIVPDRKAIGFAWIPLVTDGRLAGTEHQIPLASSLVRSYLLPESGPHIRWLDGGKASLRVKLQLVSSLYTQDQTLGEFFVNSAPPPSSDCLLNTLNALVGVPSRRVAWFLPTIMTLLLRLSCAAPVATQRQAFTTLLSLLSSISTEIDIGVTIESYVSYVLNPSEIERHSKIHLYHQIVRHWAYMISKDQDLQKEELYKHASFLFKIIYRSMVLQIYADGGLKDGGNRKDRFSASFEEDLRALVAGLTRILQAGLRVGLTNAKALCHALALFLRDLMSIMDRGVVLRLAELVANNMVPASSEVVFHDLRIAFLDILAEYEHFLPLSLPLPPEVKSIATLPVDWRMQHLPMALLLDYTTQYLLHDEIPIRTRAARLLHGLILRQLADERYACAEYVPRLAGLLLPYLPYLLPQAKTLRGRYLHERREVLIPWLWLLDSLSSTDLRLWWHKETRSRVLLFLDMLLLALDTFSYAGKEKTEERMAEGKAAVATSNTTKALLENFYTEVGTTSRTGAAGRRTYTSLREKRVAARAQAQSQSKDGDQRQFRTTLEKRRTTHVPVNEPQYAFVPQIEKNLSVEAQRIVTNALTEFMACFKMELSGVGSGLMDKFFDVLKALLQHNQAVGEVGRVYRLLQMWVVNHAKDLFYRSTNYIAEICPLLVMHCHSPHDNIRHHAAAFLASLMKQNYDEVRKNFTRVKVQVTIALSALVGRGIRNDQYLVDALQYMTKAARYLEAQDSVPRPFASQVEDLAVRLNTILRDSVKINQHSNDPEMMGDLYYRISKSYANTPDLRITWLINLANFHALHSNWAEAGQCALHMGALISEYLALKRGSSAASTSLPQNCRAFISISPNVVEEALSEISMSGTGEEGMCESQLFSDRGLISVLLDAVEYFKKGSLYEIAVQVYKILLPVYETTRDYRALSRAHADLQAIYQDIASANELQSRMLGSFYRVGFFGSGFDELDGQEFIYKEPKITRLGEITERLMDQFGERLGKERVKLWTSQGEVEREKLDPALCYIQITSVEPYFTPEENANRVTYFERYNNLQHFIFETSFTVGGSNGQAAHVRDQWKRKTILSTENFFPYVKKRIPVSHKQETCLSPIANAVETIESRAAAIRAELQAPQPSSKSLQGLLQGALLLQVHAGPREICKTFLMDEESGLAVYADADKQKLRLAFRALVEACGRALQTNSELIDADGLALHEEMQQGFLVLTQTLAPVLQPLASTPAASASPPA